MFTVAICIVFSPFTILDVETIVSISIFISIFIYYSGDLIFSGKYYLKRKDVQSIVRIGTASIVIG